jgi:hypothetical protein
VYPFEWDSDMGDLKNPYMIYLKGFLFLAILIVSVALILIDCFSWKLLALLCLVVWSAARFYYFLFYVIEKYIDPTFRFSGILSLILFISRRNKSP